MKKQAKRASKTVKHVVDVTAVPKRRKGPPLDPYSHQKFIAEWEPTPQQMQVYELMVKGCQKSEIAKAFEVTPATIVRWCDQIDEYLRTRLFGKIVNLRMRITRQYEHIYSQAAMAWERSQKDELTTELIEESGKVTATGQSGDDEDSINVNGKTISKQRRRGKSGESAYLSEMRSSLEAIRKLWAVDMNPKVLDLGDETDERVAGKSMLELAEEDAAKALAMVESLRKQELKKLEKQGEFDER